jgi:HPt (histidine-containing phosphotransfer) domain-containing protein
MNDFISKPIDAAELNRKLEKWLPPEKITKVEEPGPPRRPEGEKGKSAGQNASQNTGQNTGEEVPDRVPIFDYAGGLRNAGWDEGLYGKLLRDFRENHQSDHGEIKSALEGGNYTTAHRLAHTLKSTAGLIGAPRLRRIAGEVEKALSEENIPGAVHHLPELEAELSVLMEELSGRLEAPGSLAPGSVAPPVNRVIEKPEDKVVVSLADKLIPLLRSGNTAVLDMGPELQTIAAGAGEKGKLLAGQIEDFEFNGALKTVLEIKAAAEQRIRAGS